MPNGWNRIRDVFEAALRQPAAEARPAQRELVLQQVEQGRVGRGFDLDPASIDLQCPA